MLLYLSSNFVILVILLFDFRISFCFLLIVSILGTSLVVQWLRLNAFSARGIGFDSDLGTKISPAAWYSQKKKVLIFY